MPSFIHSEEHASTGDYPLEFVYKNTLIQTIRQTNKNIYSSHTAPPIAYYSYGQVLAVVLTQPRYHRRSADRRFVGLHACIRTGMQIGNCVSCAWHVAFSSTGLLSKAWRGGVLLLLLLRVLFLLFLLLHRGDTRHRCRPNE